MIYIQTAVVPEKENKEKMINEIKWKTFPEVIRDTSFQTEGKKKKKRKVYQVQGVRTEKISTAKHIPKKLQKSKERKTGNISREEKKSLKEWEREWKQRFYTKTKNSRR